MNEGLTNKEWKSVNELLAKANILQKNYIIKSIEKEKEKRSPLICSICGKLKNKAENIMLDTNDFVCFDCMGKKNV